MKKYTYCSVNPCHTVLVIKNELEHISFYQGETYSLPEKDAFVQSLVKQKLLKPIK